MPLNRALGGSRQPHLRHAHPIERFDAQRTSLDVDRIAHARAAAQAAQGVPADRRVGVFVDVQAELIVDVGDQRQPVDVARAVGP